jgi:hypothetical protein
MDEDLTNLTDKANDQAPLLYNWDAVYQLRREQQILANGVDEADLMKLPFSSQYPARILPKKIDRVEKLATLLLEQFDLDQVQVFPVVNTGQRFPLDLFVRFIGKGHMLISIRSRGKTKALYYDRFKELRVKRLDKPGNSVSRWLPCPLTELNEFAHWVSKNRAVFGMSSKEIRKSRIKLLVVWYPTVVGKHEQWHYKSGNMMCFKLSLLRVQALCS